MHSNNDDGTLSAEKPPLRYLENYPPPRATLRMDLKRYLGCGCRGVPFMGVPQSHLFFGLSRGRPRSRCLRGASMVTHVKVTSQVHLAKTPKRPLGGRYIKGDFIGGASRVATCKALPGCRWLRHPKGLLREGTLKVASLEVPPEWRFTMHSRGVFDSSTQKSACWKAL